MAAITLRVLDGADRGRTYQALNTPVTIGREDGNSVQLNDERVSRFHLKIQDDQDKLVLTDLESTNGTKVNGEDIQLRILRIGDLISVGRSLLVIGSREEIALKLAHQRSAKDPRGTGTIGHEDAMDSAEAANLDFELNWNENRHAPTTLHTQVAPELPDRLSPGQAAQLVEVLDFMHQRMRDLLASVRIENQQKRITLEERRWQGLVDLQSQLAIYLREIGEPPTD